MTEARTSQEVDFVLERCGLAPGARLLDVGCGPGRHVIELARRGYGVVGIDPSGAMLAAARQRALDVGVNAQFMQIKGEALSLKDRFDAVVCLFTTLGQMNGGEDNRTLIPRVHTVLRPQGWFVVEAPQRDWIAENLRESDRFGSGDHYTAVSRQYDPRDDVVTEVFEVVSPQQTRQYVLRYRVFTRDALHGMLEQAGFRVLESYEDYKSSPLQPDSATMLFFSRKSGDEN